MAEPQPGQPFDPGPMLAPIVNHEVWDYGWLSTREVYLAVHRGCGTPEDVSRVLGISPKTAANQIARLVRYGLLTTELLHKTEGRPRRHVAAVLDVKALDDAAERRGVRGRRTELAVRHARERKDWKGGAAAAPDNEPGCKRTW